MSEKIIVLVCDRDDSKHGEISVLDDPQKAERLVETLIEAGFDANRIRVFSGRSSEFQISHRPVVALVDESGEAEHGPAAREERGKPEIQEAVAPASVEPNVEEPAAGATAAESGPQEEVAGEEEAPAAAQIAAPVRFSSLFRSA